MNNDVEDAIKRVDENEASSVSLVQELLDGDSGKVEVVLKRTKTMPERMESPARDHIFHDVAGFTRFVDANKTERTIVFASVEAVVISAVLNDEAKHGFEVVALRPPYDPKFKLLDNTLLDQVLPIADFAQAVMRNRGIIKGSGEKSAQNIAMIMQQITVASETKQYIGDGKTAVNGLITTTKITAGGPEAESQLQIPDSFEVEVPIYLNTAAKKFGIDITISTKHGAVMAVVDCPELEVKKYEVFSEMIAGVGKLDGVSVVYGTPRTTSWKYNN